MIIDVASDDTKRLAGLAITASLRDEQRYFEISWRRLSIGEASHSSVNSWSAVSEKCDFGDKIPVPQEAKLIRGSLEFFAAYVVVLVCSRSFSGLGNRSGRRSGGRHSVEAQ